MVLPYPLQEEAFTASSLSGAAAADSTSHPGIITFQRTYRAKKQKCAAAASLKARQNVFLHLEQEAFSDVLDEDEIYRSMGVRTSQYSEITVPDSPVYLPPASGYPALLDCKIKEGKDQRRSSAVENRVIHLLQTSSPAAPTPLDHPEENKRRKDILSGHSTEPQPEAGPISESVDDVSAHPFLDDENNYVGGSSAANMLSTSSAAKSDNETSATAVVRRRVSLVLRRRSSQLRVVVNMVEHSNSQKPSDTPYSEPSSKKGNVCHSLPSSPSKAATIVQRSQGTADMLASGTPSIRENLMYSSAVESCTSIPNVLKCSEGSKRNCLPMEDQMRTAPKHELDNSPFLADHICLSEVQQITPKKSLKHIYPLPFDVSLELEEFIKNLEDEVFPGAHKVMRSFIYDAYGLIPSEQYRMIAMDFFDSVIAVGSTCNFMQHNIGAYSYKTDVSLPILPDNSHLISLELWRSDEFLRYINSWWYFRNASNSKISSTNMSLQQTVSSRFQISLTSRRKSDLSSRGSSAVKREGENKEPNESALDWIDLTQCCLLLLNGLGKAFQAFHEKKRTKPIEKSKQFPSVTEEHIRLWAVQYIHFGLHRLLVDQMGAHGMIFRSVFSLLCSTPAQRVPYTVFTSIFLSKVTGKLSLASIEQHTNIDFRCDYIKKLGVPYLCFSQFLRIICAKQDSSNKNNRGRSASPSSVGTISLLKVWEAIDVIMQPVMSARLFHGEMSSQLFFPVHFVRRGLELLAGVRSAWQNFNVFMKKSRRHNRSLKEDDKTPEDIFKAVVNLSPLETATHVATKCLLILVLFVNWMNADCKGKEDGDLDVRFWTQRIFAEANAYYRIAQNACTEEEQKAVCGDVVALFYDFFDSSNPSSQVAKFSEKKEMVGVDFITIFRQQVNDALEAQTRGATSKSCNANSNPNLLFFSGISQICDEDNFNDIPNGPILLDGLIQGIISSVGTIFFSYDVHMDAIITYFSYQHVGTNNDFVLDGNHYKSQLRQSKNPFREMELVTSCIKSFHSMMEKSMGYLQAFWGASRWLREEIQLCTGRNLLQASVNSSLVLTSFQKSALLLADCIIAGWPYERKQQIPFRRVPQKSGRRRKSSSRDLRKSNISNKSRPASQHSTRKREPNQLSTTNHLLEKGRDEQPFSPDETMEYLCVTQRSVDAVFGDLVIGDDSVNSFQW